MYQNPRESLYRNIDEIEAVLGLRGDNDEANLALESLKESLRQKNTV